MKLLFEHVLFLSFDPGKLILINWSNQLVVFYVGQKLRNNSGERSQNKRLPNMIIEYQSNQMKFEQDLLLERILFE